MLCVCSTLILRLEMGLIQVAVTSLMDVCRPDGSEGIF